MICYLFIANTDETPAEHQMIEIHFHWYQLGPVIVTQVANRPKALRKPKHLFIWIKFLAAWVTRPQANGSTQKTFRRTRKDNLFSKQKVKSNSYLFFSITNASVCECEFAMKRMCFPFFCVHSLRFCLCHADAQFEWKYV